VITRRLSSRSRRRSAGALLAGVALFATVTIFASPVAAGRKSPPPPKVPDDFTWSGRYIVPDLDVDVPFTWTATDGNTQMIAGSDDDPIHFTNVVDDGTLYTLTYKWPDIERRPCSPIGPFTVADLNKGLSEARFVGPEILEQPRRRRVNHFRAGLVLEAPSDLIPPIPGIGALRLPLMSGDIYVDRRDPEKFWQVLQFGIQNLYDPEQDEWIVIDKISRKPGKVELPDECAQAAATTTTAPTPST
jgi:hypothetical protein